MGTKKLKLYATVYSKNSPNPTVIRLKTGKHKNILKFLHAKTEEFVAKTEKNDDRSLLYAFKKEDWAKIANELKNGYKIEYTEIRHRTQELCILCSEDYRKIMLKDNL